MYMQNSNLKHISKYCTSPDLYYMCTRSCSYYLFGGLCDVCVFFQWLKDGFLKYLQDWEDCVHSREGFSKAEAQKMQLSRETVEGLRITGE